MPECAVPIIIMCMKQNDYRGARPLTIPGKGTTRQTIWTNPDQMSSVSCSVECDPCLSARGPASISPGALGTLRPSSRDTVMIRNQLQFIPNTVTYGVPEDDDGFKTSRSPQPLKLELPSSRQCAGMARGSVRPSRITEPLNGTAIQRGIPLGG